MLNWQQSLPCNIPSRNCCTWFLSARRLAPKYEDVWRTQIQALLALGDADRIRQARLIRNEARTRFPHSEWTFSRLDAASEVAAIAEPPTTANVLGSPGAQPSPPAPASEPVIATQPVAAASPTPIPAPAPVAAATDKYELEAGVSYERLSGAINSWRSRYVVAEWRRPDRKMLYAGVRETDRFALDDREVHAGAVLPINPATQVQLEAGHSDTHRTLAARYGSLQLQYQPARGWLLGAGLRRSVYDIGQARVLNFSIDRYISAERFSYTLYEGAPDGSSLAPSHRWQWAHYYGDRDWIGITVIRGRETEYIGGTTFLNSAVSGASLSGRHSFNSAWALIWDAGYQSQGDFYTRSGVHLALRHAF